MTHHEITRSTIGSSTTLAAVNYKCSCGASRNMMGATRDGALSDIGIYCQGNRPWLGKSHEDCNQQLKVVQAGGSNVWFPTIKSSIWIPPIGGNAEIQRGIEKHREVLESTATSDGVFDKGRLENGVAEAIAEVLHTSCQTLEKGIGSFTCKD